jgi:VanZ family protein
MNYINAQEIFMIKEKKIVSWILLIGWMILIFYMSNQPADVSNGQSDFVIRILGTLGIELNDYFGNLASFIVRKGAHFTEYLILFFFSYNVNRNYFKKGSKFYAVIFVFLYALSDEFHQSLIPGREMMFRDVIIDTSGGIFGSIILYIIRKLKNNYAKETR